MILLFLSTCRAVVTRDQQNCRDLQRPARLGMLLDTPAASLETQLRHSWNPDDRSLNIFVKEDDRLTFHRLINVLSFSTRQSKYSSSMIIWLFVHYKLSHVLARSIIMKAIKKIV